MISSASKGCLRSICFFFSYRIGIYESYKGLFDGGSSTDSEDIIEENNIDESPQEKKKRELEEKQEFEKRRRWNWFGVIYKLAQGDITKFQFVVKENFILCMNTLAYIKEYKIES